MLLENLSKQEIIAIIHQQAAKNSHNSHRSPSSDGLKKHVVREVNEQIPWRTTWASRASSCTF